jgi:spermidine/putrescine transport system permease protein
MKQLTSSRRRPFRIQWLKLYSILVIFYLFFPIAIITLFSFNASPAVSFPIRSLSLRWYGEILSSPNFLFALKNSLVVASLTTILCLVIGMCAALAVTRYSFRMKPFVQGVFLLPLSLPGLFIGLALLSFFISLKVRLSLGTVILGHLIYTLPYFFLVASARLERFDRILEEVSQDLGCNAWQTFWKVNFPIVSPSILGAALIVFALSFDEFLITFFVIGTQSTLPMLIWSMMRKSIDPRVNAISVILIVASLVFIYIVTKIVDISEIEI